MGLFSRKPPRPPLSDVSALSVDERLATAAWAEAAPDSSDSLVAVNADGGTILRIGGESFTTIKIGVVIVYRTRVSYVFEDKGSIRTVSRSNREIRSLNQNMGGDFQITFSPSHPRPTDFWFVPADHEVLLAAFRQVWSSTSIG